MNVINRVVEKYYKLLLYYRVPYSITYKGNQFFYYSIINKDMSMMYNPEKGWIEIEIPNKILKEDFNQIDLEIKQNMEEIERHLKNIRGYVNSVFNGYKTNPNDNNSIEQIKGLTGYLRKTIGPGMIGDWKHNA